MGSRSQRCCGDQSRGRQAVWAHFSTINPEVFHTSISLYESIIEEIALAWFGELVYVLALKPQLCQVNHARLCAVTTKHSFDLSISLQHLNQAGFLESTG